MKIAYGAAVFLSGIFLEWICSTHLALLGLAPQVLLILTVSVALLSGPAIGQSFAFGWGLYLDLMSPHLFGANALTLTLIGYWVGVVRRQMDASSPASQAMLAGLVSVLYFILLALIGLAFRGKFFWPGWRFFFLEPFLNALAAPFGFLFVRALMP
ncbi:MAG: rod shape-determining protein MreD [Elusimicrobia bacterium]|nr:rod shape-determining protein MreD [Elusimicrobiota bacterium]